MKNPLKNDIDTAPQHEICQPEPWEWLTPRIEFARVNFSEILVTGIQKNYIILAPRICNVAFGLNSWMISQGH